MNLRRYFYFLDKTLSIFSLALLAVLFAASGVLAQSNPIVTENGLTGTRNWQIPSSRAALSREIEGYASATSVNVGSPITFYVSAKQAQVAKIEIYRMGYYPDGAGSGYGGRYITTIPSLPITNQPLPEANHDTGLIECNWDATTQWTPPTGTVSGFFVAKLVGKRYDSYIIFVVRDDSRTSDYVFQSAVTTYQAYNYFPGNLDLPCPDNPTVICPDWHSGKSLYGDIGFGPLVPISAPLQYQDKQARMVSFNRPYMVDNNNVYYSAGQFFKWEYNMVRFMEKRGLDVTYITNIDTHANATNFTAGKHKAFLTAGHDEYYSWEMRDNLEQARNRMIDPLHLGFFSSNDVYWQIRLADSSASNTAPAGAPNRTIICYKLHVNDGLRAAYGDPNRRNDFIAPVVLTDNHEITQKWRDNKAFMQTCPNGGTGCYKEDEDELVGAMTDDNFIGGVGNFTFSSECMLSDCWVRQGTTATSFPSLVGYEPVIVVNSYNDRSTPRKIGESTAYYPAPPAPPTASGPAHSVYYKMNTGGRVFTAGTNYWAWGLDPYPGGEPNATHPYDWLSNMYNADAETMTMNILNCFKVNSGSACGE